MDEGAVRRPVATDASVPEPTVNHGSFFGRDADLAALRKLIDDHCRLITITGPGGVGKTRFALNAGRMLARDEGFADGQHVIALASISDESLVVPTIARSLGIVAEDERPPAERLAIALAGQRLLLIIDNFEHVIGAAVELATLLDFAPEVTMLVTSRRALRLSREQEFPLSPLATPRAGDAGTLAEIQQSPAVSLFVTRATAANPSFKLTEGNAAAVATICARLDGLPLAIELAAARSKLLSPQALASRLTGRLQLLTSGPRDVPRRQQTLRDAIAWSYELLPEEERGLFRRLAVFAGGFPLEAAEEVCRLEQQGRGRAGDLRQPDVMDGVFSLVDQSLLVQEESEGGLPRFRMLETIREFALERLDAEDETAEVRDAHARLYVSLAEHAASVEYGREEAERLRLIEPELDNVRAALHWLLASCDDQERAFLGLRLVTAMVRFFDTRGYLEEEARWLNRALELVPLRATAEHGNALTALGVNAWFQGDLEAARAYQGQALEIWREREDSRLIVRSLWFLALVAGKLGDTDELERLHRESAPLVDRIGVTLWTRVPQSMLALAELARGNGRAVIDGFRETLKYHQQHGFFWARAWVLGVMAEGAQLDGDRAESLRLYQESLKEFHRLGDVYGALDAMTAIAILAVWYGQGEIAARLLGAVAIGRQTVGYRITWSTVTDDEAEQLTRNAVGAERFAHLTSEGKQMTMDEAVQLAMTVAPASVVVEEATRTEKRGDAFGLSPRERDVLRLVTEGKSNSEIGASLFISPRTAGTHVANILGKLGVSSRAAAVAIALQQQLI